MAIATRTEVDFPNEWKGVVFEYEDHVHVFVQDPQGRDKGSYLFDGPNFKQEFYAFFLEPAVIHYEHNARLAEADMTDMIVSDEVNW